MLVGTVEEFGAPRGVTLGVAADNPFLQLLLQLLSRQRNHTRLLEVKIDGKGGLKEVRGRCHYIANTYFNLAPLSATSAMNRVQELVRTRYRCIRPLRPVLNHQLIR